MNIGKWLIVFGGIFLILGLFFALSSSRLDSQVMGESRLGVLVFGPDPDTPEMENRKKDRDLADLRFNWGLALTFIGVILQTTGSILPLSHPTQRVE